MKSLSILALVAITLTSCSTYKAARVYTFENSRMYTMSFDAAWDKVVEWFAVNGTPIKNMEKASGFIATDYGLDAGAYTQYCDCGKSGTYEVVGDPVGNFNVLIRKEGEGVKVVVNAIYKTPLISNDLYGKEVSRKTITCNSTGEIERSILDYVGK